MCMARLSARAPSARRVGTGVLQGYRLAFHKAGERDGSAKCDASFTGDGSHRVIGVVYELEPRDKEKLDRIEGVGFGYESKVLEVEMKDGVRIRASVYLATVIDASLKPYSWYLEHVIRGALENGLPPWYIASIREVGAVEDPDPLRSSRELSIYPRT